MNRECSSLQKELQGGKSVIIFTTGTSMEPLLFDKRKKNATHVLVMPVDGELSVGQLPVVLLPDGRYMLHRIIRVIRENGSIYYQTRGDNCISSERISEDAVFGVVTEIYRKKKTIKVTDKGYQLYVKSWMWSYPLRVVIKTIHIILAKIKRKIYEARKKP